VRFTDGTLDAHVGPYCMLWLVVEAHGCNVCKKIGNAPKLKKIKSEVRGIAKW